MEHVKIDYYLRVNYVSKWKGEVNYFASHENKKILNREATIALWFRLWPPLCGTGFESQQQHQHFFQFVKFDVGMSKGEKKQIRGRDWPIFSLKRNWRVCSSRRSVAKIHLGQLESFELGNLDSLRDWGHAKDYIRAMWEMLQVLLKTFKNL